MKAISSYEVELTDLMPTLASSSLVALPAYICATEFEIFSTIGRCVPAGAAIAIQVELSSIEGRPAASLRLGTPGNIGSGLLVYFASARYWPPWTCGSAVP